MEPIKFSAQQKPDTAPAAAQRRRHGRVKTDEVPSTLGRVIDLSASGMRVSAGRKGPGVGAILDVGIQGVDGPFLIRAKVIRVIRRGLMGSEIGLEFDSPAENVRAELSQLARQAVAAPTMITYRAAA